MAGRDGAERQADASVAGAAVARDAFELAHAGTLQWFPELVAELGGDADGLMRAAGIDPADIAGRVPRLNYRAMIDLLELAAMRLKCPDFGMRLAERQGGGKVFGPIGVVMRNSATLGEALHYVTSHAHAYGLAAAIPVERDRASGRVFVGFDILLDNAPDKTQTLEQLMLLAHYNAQEITGGRARVREIRFRHQPVSPLRAYRQYFGCDVRFDQPQDAMVFNAQDMDAPIHDPNSQHYELAKLFIEANFPVTAAPMHARVRGLVMKRLGVADCRIDSIAEELCLHPRTLHRRLAQEHKSFEDIKDEVRRDMARYYIERTGVPFSRISEKLGFSEASVLSRRCRHWFGASPRALRQSGKGLDAGTI